MATIVLLMAQAALAQRVKRPNAQRPNPNRPNPQTMGSGTGPLGNSILRNGDYTTTWDANCERIDGSWQASKGETSRSTKASMMRCKGQCPTGTVTHIRAGRTITITFDGTSVAKWTTANGKSGIINLICLF